MEVVHQFDLRLQAAGPGVLTNGLPSVDVDDEAWSLVTAQQLVLSWRPRESGEFRGSKKQEGLVILCGVQGSPTVAA